MLAARKEEVVSLEGNAEKTEARLGAIAGDLGAARQQLGRVEGRLDNVDERFDKVDAQFEKVDERFDKVDARFEKVDERFDKVEERLGGLQVSVAVLTDQSARTLADVNELRRDTKDLRKEISNAKIWALLIAAAMLGVLARGFHWI